MEMIFAGSNMDIALKKYENKEFVGAINQFERICVGTLYEDENLRGVACQLLGELNENGHGGLMVNHQKAFHYYTKACQFNKKSCLMLGKAYYLGVGVTKDKENAFYYIRQSCEAGYQDACKILN